MTNKLLKQTIVCFTLILTLSGTNSYAVAYSTDLNKLQNQENSALISKIQQAFRKQQIMFKTMEFKISYVIPIKLPCLDPQIMLQMNHLELASNSTLYQQYFQTNSSGQYSNMIQARQLIQQNNNSSTITTGKLISFPFGASLNNKIFRSLSTRGKACIYPAVHHPQDNTFNPGQLMLHLFDNNLINLLNNPQNCKISRQKDGTIKITNIINDYSYQYTCDPAQNYMVINYQKHSIHSNLSVPIYEYGIKYRQTRQGFNYPEKYYIKRFCQLTMLAQTADFKLNPSIKEFILDFPLGIIVNNYTVHQNYPIQYRSRSITHTHTQITRESHIITGRVIDTNSNPISNVPIIIHPRLPEGAQCSGRPFAGWYQFVWDGLTDETGRFSIDINQCTWHRLCLLNQYETPLDYTLVLTHPDFSAHIAHGVDSSQSPLEITLSQNTSLGGCVQTFKNKQYHPLTNIMVTAELVDKHPHNIWGLPTQFCTITNHGGRFTFKCPYTVSYHGHLSDGLLPKNYNQLLRIKCKGSSELVVLNNTHKNPWVMLTVDPNNDDYHIITGTVTDRKGQPLAGASIQVCGTKQTGFYDTCLHKQRPLWPKMPVAVTNNKGQFILSVKAKKICHLLVQREFYGPVIIQNVPSGKRYLNLSLSREGTLTGTIYHIVHGQKLPLPNAEVKATQTFSGTLPVPFLNADRITRTDSKGNFYFDHLIASMQDNLRAPPDHTAQFHIWDIFCRNSQTTITLTPEITDASLEFTIKANTVKQACFSKK